MAPRGSGARSLDERIAAVDFQELARQLDELGHARVPGLLEARECAGLARLYAEPRHFRKRVEMERHRFGAGEYQYFAAPLPEPVAALRRGFYPPLARIANDWQARLRQPRRFPATLARFLSECASAGQRKPTPLLLRYEAGGYNRMHQDLYGEIAFPLQLAVLLSRPGIDFEGGEFLLLEQRPRMQSRVDGVPLERGDAVVFPTRERPVASARGHARAQLRHGVSRVRRGLRLTLGVIFHDARS
jgi:hypothetical protein